MQENNKSYRIHTGIGSDSPNVINVPLQQTFDTFEILTLKLNQTNAYNFYESSYGVIVGRVLANDAFGIPNAKVSIFIPVEDGETLATKGIYPFTSIRSADANGVRYNLLPDEALSACYQNVGTFPNKRATLLSALRFPPPAPPREKPSPLPFPEPPSATDATLAGCH